MAAPRLPEAATACESAEAAGSPRCRGNVAGGGLPGVSESQDMVRMGVVMGLAPCFRNPLPRLQLHDDVQTRPDPSPGEQQRPSNHARCNRHAGETEKGSSSTRSESASCGPLRFCKSGLRPATKRRGPTPNHAILFDSCFQGRCTDVGGRGPCPARQGQGALLRCAPGVRGRARAPRAEATHDKGVLLPECGASWQERRSRASQAVRGACIYFAICCHLSRSAFCPATRHLNTARAQLHRFSRGSVRQHVP